MGKQFCLLNISKVFLSHDSLINPVVLERLTLFYFRISCLFIYFLSLTLFIVLFSLLNCSMSDKFKVHGFPPAQSRKGFLELA